MSDKADANPTRFDFLRVSSFEKRAGLRPLSLTIDLTIQMLYPVLI